MNRATGFCQRRTSSSKALASPNRQRWISSTSFEPIDSSLSSVTLDGANGPFDEAQWRFFRLALNGRLERFLSSKPATLFEVSHIGHSRFGRHFLGSCHKQNRPHTRRCETDG